MLKNYHHILLYIPSLIFASTLFPAQRAFIRMVPKLTFALPLAMIGAFHHSNNLYSQSSRPNLSEMHTVELNTFDLAILKEVIREKSHALAAEIRNKKQSADQPISTSENTIFSIKRPDSLSEEERARNILDRIAEQYIGVLPEKIKDIVAHFQFKRASSGRGMSNAILLHGEPGDGKSFLVETLANQLQVDYLYCDAGAFIDKYSGESSKNIINFFKLAKENKQPIFIFIDEIDAIGTARDGRPGEYRSALTTLLIQIQALAHHEDIFIFAATNTPYDLDPAIKNRFSSRTVKIDKIRKKEDYIALFTKSLKEQGMTSEKENKELATDIFYELRGNIPLMFSMQLSRRELVCLIPNALARKHMHETINKDSSKTLLFFVKQIIKEIEDSMYEMSKKPHNS